MGFVARQGYWFIILLDTRADWKGGGRIDTHRSLLERRGLDKVLFAACWLVEGGGTRCAW
ncbi:hypothetical protein M419DRAFT_117335 [Trichoderma reesei RUT C-30]|uniref:Uncharacterized protein n=1 Tax=Hypocrea jecorina (strain ATCC 56765 / BCRC 32924 / NRRL 11460 / Rut C-30) TaxID=1344414 RepID=A0A024SLH8_HYPJR|nr:hypothetical protein M419DRAFT_117335 [Trichoderma reesei RUT C-30]